MKTTKAAEPAPMPSIHTLFTGLAERLDRVTPEITARIRAEIPGYSLLPHDEHAADVHRQIRNVVSGLVSGSGPTASATEHARTVGHRRAAAGVTLPDVIEAYHIAYREIWTELLRDARESKPPLDSALASVVSLLWLWFHRLSAAVAEGHAAETQARRSDRLERERELMDQLAGRAPADDAIAAELGYQADGEFMVACVAGLGRHDAADRLAEALHTSSQQVTCTYHEDHVRRHCPGPHRRADPRRSRHDPADSENRHRNPPPRSCRRIGLPSRRSGSRGTHERGPPDGRVRARLADVVPQRNQAAIRGNPPADDGSGPAPSRPCRDRPGLLQMPVLSQRMRPPAPHPSEQRQVSP